LEINLKLNTVCGIQNIPKCSVISRVFVNYLIDLGVVKGTWIPIVNRFVLKYALEKGVIIQTERYSQKKGFDIRNFIQYAQKTQKRACIKMTEPSLFSEWGS
jgi:hypothetical protein